MTADAVAKMPDVPGKERLFNGQAVLTTVNLPPAQEGMLLAGPRTPHLHCPVYRDV